MMKLILAAILLPLAMAPALAHRISDTTGQTGARHTRGAAPTGACLNCADNDRSRSISVSPAERIQIDRQAVPSSAFSDSGS
ncbi:hypothetical protein [Phreatobacter stygius]|uniref:Uncharacterized protein n=1 Tax=Phreatobacter stygius TaxID=1940610 RepID=A0A4D7B8Z4_9HYPH|nr:hypothetical protein [Phreatobacter stygius]QCI66036.1 hypothetical protein E8M01_18570 [Phreatobacter stygius]